MKRTFTCFLILGGLMMNRCSSDTYITNNNLEKRKQQNTYRRYSRIYSK